LRANIPIWAKNVGDKLGEWIDTAIAYFKENIPIWIQNISSAFGTLIGKFIELLPGILSGIFIAIGGWIPLLILKVGEIGASIGQWLVDNWPIMKEKFVEFWSNVWAGLVTFFTVTLPIWIENLSDWFSDVWDGFVLWLTEDLPVWIEAFTDWLGDVWDGFVTWLTKDLPVMIKTFSDWLGDVWDGFVKWVTTDGVLLAEDLRDALFGLFDKVITWLVEEAPEYVKGFLQFFADNVITPFVAAVLESGPDWLSDLVQVGADMIAGIQEGLTAAWVDLKQWFTDRIEDVPQWMRDLLKISSPSQVFAEIGGQMVAGLREGLDFSNIERDITKGLNLNGLSAQFSAQLAGSAGQLAAASVSQRANSYQFNDGAFSNAFPGVASTDDAEGIMETIMNDVMGRSRARSHF
jgi:hypothetical protein